MNKLLMIVITYFVIYIIGFFTGKMSSKNIVFGVTLKEEYLNHPDIRFIRRSFLMKYGLVLGLPMVLLIIMELQGYSFWYFMIFTGLWLIITPVLFAISHKKAKQFKEENTSEIKNKPVIKSAQLSNRKPEMPMLRNYFIFASIIVLATLMITVVHYDDIPDQVPMHYNNLGEVDNYADKNIGSVSLLIIIQGLITLLIFGSTYASIKYSKRKINPKKPETSALQHKIAMKRYSVLMASIAIIVNLLFATIQLSTIGLYSFNQTILNVITYAPLIVIMIGMLWFFITTGMTGDKIKLDLDEIELDVESSDNEDRYWKGGMIYYNKNDSSIFVQKRFGGGFTINFGNPLGKLMLVLLLLFVIGSIVLPLILI